MSIKTRLLFVLGGAITMCNGLQLFTAVESLVATPYAKLEKKVASQQIPAVAAAPAPRKTLASELADGASFDHSAWDALLKAHVRDDGTVDYGGLERDGDAFRGYLAALAAADVDPHAVLNHHEGGALPSVEELATTLRADPAALTMLCTVYAQDYACFGYDGMCAQTLSQLDRAGALD